MATKAVENNHDGMIKRFCMYCGKEFWTTSKNARICDDCKEERKNEQRKAQAKKQKERNEKLGLVNLSISKDSREWLKAKAKEKGVNMWQVVDELIKEASK